MNEELKARLLAWTKTSSSFGLDSIGKDIAKALEAIEELERQLAERDAEIAKLIQAIADHVTVRSEQYAELKNYREAPVVAWRYELKAGEYTFSEKRYLDETYAPRLKPLIVKPGE